MYWSSIFSRKETLALVPLANSVYMAKSDETILIALNWWGGPQKRPFIDLLIDILLFQMGLILGKKELK